MLRRDHVRSIVGRLADEAIQTVPAAGERLSWDEIKRLYPDEWVVLVDIEGHGDFDRRGVVFAHASKRREASAMASGLRECGNFWTGEIIDPISWYMLGVRLPV